MFQQPLAEQVVRTDQEERASKGSIVVSWLDRDPVSGPANGSVTRMRDPRHPAAEGWIVWYAGVRVISEDVRTHREKGRDRLVSPLS